MIEEYVPKGLGRHYATAHQGLPQGLAGPKAVGDRIAQAVHRYVGTLAEPPSQSHRGMKVDRPANLASFDVHGTNRPLFTEDTHFTGALSDRGLYPLQKLAQLGKG